MRCVPTRRRGLRSSSRSRTPPKNRSSIFPRRALPDSIASSGIFIGGPTRRRRRSQAEAAEDEPAVDAAPLPTHPEPKQRNRPWVADEVGLLAKARSFRQVSTRFSWLGERAVLRSRQSDHRNDYRSFRSNHRNLMRHSRLVVLATLSTAVVATVSCTHASTSASPTVAASARWLPTWSPSQSASAARPAAGTRDPVPTYANTTIRQVIHTTIGGDRVRIRISNEYGDRPLKIGGAHIALRTAGSSIDAASDRPLLFDGKTSAIVRAGAVLTSDPLSFPVPKLGDVTVSIYLPDSARTSTRHSLGVATTYVSRTGDLTTRPTFTADTTLRSWIFLSGVEVLNPGVQATIVATGNSITDGF